MSGRTFSPLSLDHDGLECCPTAGAQHRVVQLSTLGKKGASEASDQREKEGEKNNKRMPAMLLAWQTRGGRECAVIRVYDG